MSDIFAGSVGKYFSPIMHGWKFAERNKPKKIFSLLSGVCMTIKSCIYVNNTMSDIFAGSEDKYLSPITFLYVYD